MAHCVGYTKLALHFTFLTKSISCVLCPLLFSSSGSKQFWNYRKNKEIEFTCRLWYMVIQLQNEIFRTHPKLRCTKLLHFLQSYWLLNGCLDQYLNLEKTTITTFRRCMERTDGITESLASTCWMRSKFDPTKLLKYRSWWSHWSCELTANKPQKVLTAKRHTHTHHIFHGYRPVITMYMYIIICKRSKGTFINTIRLVSPMNASGEIQIHRVL